MTSAGHPTRRRLLAGAGAGLAAAALAGCGSGSGGASPDGTALTFWTWAPGIEEVVALWNAQNPDVQVLVSRQDAGDAAVTKLLTAVRAGNGAPDLVQAEYQALTSLVAANAIADISGDLDPATEGRFSEGIWSAVSIADGVYAVPQDTGPLQFYYRADVFDDLGLSAPETWDDYADCARAIHAADPSMYLGTFSSTDPGLFVGLAQQAGASWWGIDGERWRVDIDAEPTQRVAALWGGLVEEGVLSVDPMYTPQWNAALNAGTQVGWVSAAWAPGVLEGNAGSTAGNWRMAPIPQWEAGANATGNWGGSTTAAVIGGAHQAEAVRFAEWMNTSDEGVLALVRESGVFPADLVAAPAALAEPPAFFAEQPDFYELSARNAEGVQPFVFGPNVNVAYSLFNDAFAVAARTGTAAAFAEAVTTVHAGTVADLESQGYQLA
ncbi:ABC transporter substrate-binding protein [Brachybacterium sp. DNPG3]